jgi:hypothetical protein
MYLNEKNVSSVLSVIVCIQFQYQLHMYETQHFYFNFYRIVKKRSLRAFYKCKLILTNNLDNEIVIITTRPLTWKCNMISHFFKNSHYWIPGILFQQWTQLCPHLKATNRKCRMWLGLISTAYIIHVGVILLSFFILPLHMFFITKSNKIHIIYGVPVFSIHWFTSPCLTVVSLIYQLFPACNNVDLHALSART